MARETAMEEKGAEEEVVRVERAMENKVAKMEEG